MKLYRRFFAWMMARAGDHPDERVMADKRRLIGALSGTVVEIGPGAGANVPYYRSDVRLIAVEPNRFMHPYLEAAAAERRLAIEIVDGSGEQLPLDTGSADAVVATLVLCSVDDPKTVLAEVLRVLGPGGRFVFVEHVAAPPGSRLRRLQGWMAPLWRRLGDGCRPDRETWRLIEEAGFSQLDYRRLDAHIPIPIVRPHIVGGARKPDRARPV